jgi:hypothetical protein
LLPEATFPSAEKFSQLVDEEDIRAENVFEVALENIWDIAMANENQLAIDTTNNLQNMMLAPTEQVKKAFYIKKILKKNLKTEANTKDLGAIKQTFQMRTTAAINTLKNIGCILSDFGLQQAKVVLIMGGRHLYMKATHKPAWDLTRFYEQLNHHKAAILFSHKTMIARQDQERELSELKKLRQSLENG